MEKDWYNEKLLSKEKNKRKNMRKIRNINEITETDLMNIKNSLIKFDEYLRDFAIKPTDKNVALYEHWIDCMGDIEDIIITER